MAKNETHNDGYYLSVACSNPTTPASGGPVRFGLLTGVALTDEDSSGNTTVDFGPRAWSLSVKGVNDSGNSAVAAGDAIFYVDADTPKFSKKASGYFFGFALAAVTSGATATIEVVHGPSPGSGSISSGAIGATQLADEAVTAAKLSNQLATGYIPLPLTAARLIASNDIPAVGTPDGGLISLDTDPTLKRVSGATDKQLRIAWAAASVVEVQLGQFVYPPDLDDAAAVVVHVLAGMSGATNTPVLAIGYFEGVGDTNAGGNTASLAAAVAEKTVTIAAADVGVAPQVATVTVIPAAHGTDADAVRAALAALERDGVIEIHPSDPSQARLATA